MSIASEISRINDNIAAAYSKCEEKGAALPQTQNCANLADTIDSIPAASSDTYTEKKVRFYDWNGALLYEYSEAEALELNALPAMPVHEGFVSVKWSWTLADIKSHLNADHTGVCVGCYFKPSDNKTKIYIRLEGSDTIKLRLIQSAPDQASIDWGDGSAPETLHTPYGTGNSRTAYDAVHTYSPAAYPAEYVISISLIGSGWYGMGAQNYHDYSICAGDQTYGKLIRRIHLADCVDLYGSPFYNASGASIITAPTPGHAYTHKYSYYNCYNLRFSIITTNIQNETYYNCYSLRALSICEEIQQITQIQSRALCNCFSLSDVGSLSGVRLIGDEAFCKCSSLESVGSLSSCTRIQRKAFSECTALKDIGSLYSCTMIEDSAFYSCRELPGIKLPSCLTSIGAAFKTNVVYSDSALTYVDLTAYTDPAAIPTLTGSFSNTFIDRNRFLVTPEFYVASEAMRVAFSGATNWSGGASCYRVKEAQP